MGIDPKWYPIIEKLCNAEITEISREDFENLPAHRAEKFKIGDTECAIMIPESKKDIYEYYNELSEKQKSLKEELESLRSFLEKTEKRLENEDFIKKAPKDVTDKEYKKWWDCISKINFTMSKSLSIIEEQINILKQIEDERRRNQNENG